MHPAKWVLCLIVPFAVLLSSFTAIGQEFQGTSPEEEATHPTECQTDGGDDEFDLRVSSSLPIYGGYPLELDIPEANRHSYFVGINWNVFFASHYGIGVDLDALMGGEDGLQMFGAVMALYHPIDRWEELELVDPFAGIGVAFTSTSGHYTDDTDFSSYEPELEVTGGVQLGANFWFSEWVGAIVKSKFYFNRGFEGVQIMAGLNIALFNFTRSEIIAGSRASAAANQE